MTNWVTVLADIAADFRRNVDSVHNLIDFDRFVLDFAIEQVDRLHRRLATHDPNPMTNGEHTLEALRRVREHDSLRRHYGVIFNQCIVLLVSYFASALDDVFQAALPLVLSRGKAPALLREELRVTVEELITLQAEPEAVGELFKTKKDISFQDMQSIVRAFKDYIGVDVPRDEHTDNIIIAQACRHVIVHSGGEADKRLVRQVAQATRRTVKTTIHVGEQIQFTPDEVRVVSRAWLHS